MLRIAAKPSESLPKEEAPELDLSPLESLESGMDQETEPPSRFFDQLIITVICLILMLLGLQSGHPGFQWIRERLHAAFFASTESTFGILGHSPVLQSVLRAGQNLIRLEEISQPLRRNGNNGLGTDGAERRPGLTGAVWPANGNVTRSFGWQYNPVSHIREFNSGVEIGAQPGAPVYALQAGEIIEIARQPGRGWQVTVNHGAGWVSIYRNLGRVEAQIGQQIMAGSPIGILEQTATGNAPLWLEVKYQNQPVDPLTLFAT